MYINRISQFSTFWLIIGSLNKLAWKAVDKPRKIWHITVALLIAVHLQLNKNNYFNFAEGRREKRREAREAEGSERG